VQAGDRFGGETLTSFGYPLISDNRVVVSLAIHPGGTGFLAQQTTIAESGERSYGPTLIGVRQPAMNIRDLAAFTVPFLDRHVHSSLISLCA